MVDNPNHSGEFQNSTEQSGYSLNTHDSSDYSLRESIRYAPEDTKEDFKNLGTLESEIVSLYFSKTPNFAYSFTGLKRQLGNVHQQSLTNSLDRLVEDSWLVKDQYGNYTLDPTKTPKNFYQSSYNNVTDTYWDENWLGRPMLHIPVKKIYQELHGKWFGKSRFIGGMYDSQKNEALLEWSDTTNKSETQVKIRYDIVGVRFKNVEWFERDKTLDVFNRSFNSHNIMLVFEKEHNYKN
ncbi:MAG: hypothetical protein ACFFD1_01765 [Candidatus Thorarchaeota archaeon]